MRELIINELKYSVCDTYYQRWCDAQKLDQRCLPPSHYSDYLQCLSDTDLLGTYVRVKLAEEESGYGRL